MSEPDGAAALPLQERRLIYAKDENTRHIRHARILERWADQPRAVPLNLKSTKWAAGLKPAFSN